MNRPNPAPPCTRDSTRTRLKRVKLMARCCFLFRSAGAKSRQQPIASFGHERPYLPMSSSLARPRRSPFHQTDLLARTRRPRYEEVLLAMTDTRVTVYLPVLLKLARNSHNVARRVGRVSYRRPFHDVCGAITAVADSRPIDMRAPRTAEFQ